MIQGNGALLIVSSTHRTVRSALPRGDRNGFSLIEVLIALGVIGLLIGILVPMLGRARGQTLEIVSLSNTRGVISTLASHATSSGDRFPFPLQTTTGNNGTTFYGPFYWTPSGEPDGDAGSVGYGSIWYFASIWPLIVRDVAPWTEHYGTWISPGHPKLASNPDSEPLWSRGAPGVSYHYSTAFMVSPRLLEENAPAEWSLIQPTRSSMVAYPASKVIAFDADRSYLARGIGDSSRWPTGFVDGSASLRDRASARIAHNPLKSDPWGDSPYHDTPGGVTGRDF